MILSGATVGVEFAHSSRVCVGFLQVLGFPPTNQRCAPKVIGVSTLSQSERVCVGAHADCYGRALGRVGSHLAP